MAADMEIRLPRRIGQFLVVPRQIAKIGQQGFEIDRRKTRILGFELLINEILVGDFFVLQRQIVADKL